MGPEGNGRGGLLSAGGILSIIVGALEVLVGGFLLVALLVEIPFWPSLPFGPQLGPDLILGPGLTIMLVIAIVVLVLGVIAIVGGISAVQRGNFGLALAGAIGSFVPLNMLGLLAVIFVALARREFLREEY